MESQLEAQLSNMIEMLQSKLKDSFVQLVVILCVSVVFGSNTTTELIGLVYPAYYMYHLMESKMHLEANNIEPVMKFLILYTHIQMMSIMFSFVGIYYYTIKTMMVALLMYALLNYPHIVEKFYLSTIDCDRSIIAFAMEKTKLVIGKYSVVISEIKN